MNRQLRRPFPLSGFSLSLHASPYPLEKRIIADSAYAGVHVESFYRFHDAPPAAAGFEIRSSRFVFAADFGTLRRLIPLISPHLMRGARIRPFKNDLRYSPSPDKICLER
jgi:hypothetical protein